MKYKNKESCEKVSYKWKEAPQSKTMASVQHVGAGSQSGLV